MKRFLLPRGNPVKEQVNPGKIDLGAALGKLQQGRFSGYLRFDFSVGMGLLLFREGRLVSALCEAGGERLASRDALACIFRESLAGGATLDIYRLSDSLAGKVHALLHGEILHQAQDLELIDIKLLLARMRDRQLSGCLRIYSRDHAALIFYRQGVPLGFFHDGATELQTTADTSLSVAREPGAKVDVVATRTAPETDPADDLAGFDLTALWARARAARPAGTAGHRLG